MGYDEVVFFCRGVGEGVGLVGFETIQMLRAALTQEVEHRGAGVDGFGLQVGILGEELGEEAAVSVAYDEGGFLLGEGWEIVAAGLLQDGAEG